MKKIFLLFLALCIFFSAIPLVYAQDNKSISSGYICATNLKTNITRDHKALSKDGKIYMMPEDIATICEYSCETVSINENELNEFVESSFALSSALPKNSLDKLFKNGKFEFIVFTHDNVTDEIQTQIFYSNGYAQTMGKSYEIDEVEHAGETYFSLEKMLYLMHAQWCVEGSRLYYYPLGGTIFDFVEMNFKYVYEHSVKNEDLLNDGESKLGHATRVVFSHIINDVEVLAFVPYGDYVVRQNDYEEALLQLATTEDSFIEGTSSKEIEKHLKDSPFQTVQTGLTVSDTTLESLTALPNAISKSKLNKFSKWNDFSTIDTTQLQDMQKTVEVWGDVVTVANALADYNEISTRSLEWDKDFVAGLDILYTMNEDWYGTDGKLLANAADDLLDEYANPTKEAQKKVLDDIGMAIFEKLLAKTPVGYIESIIAISNVLIKSNPACAKSIEVADLMHTVHSLIDIETIYLNEFVGEYIEYEHYLQNSNDPSSSLRVAELFYAMLTPNPQTVVEHKTISDMRCALEMFLKTSLRNKTYVYFFREYNNGAGWCYTADATALKEDIYKTYALLSELILTRDYDRLLVLDSFENMYSDEYGCIREKISADILTDSPSSEKTPSNSEQHSSVSFPVDYFGKTFSELKRMFGVNYTCSTVDHGVFSLHFDDTPLSFWFVEPALDKIMSIQGGDETPLESKKVSSVVVSTKENITLAPNQPYTSVDTYTTLQNKASSISLVDDEMWGTKNCEITIGNYKAIYCWGMDKFTTASPAGYIVIYPASVDSPYAEPQENIDNVDGSLTEKEFDLGKISNQHYENRFIGIGYVLNSGWTFYTEEQLKALNQITENVTGDAYKDALKQATVAFDMLALSPNATDSISVNLERVDSSTLQEFGVVQYCQNVIPSMEETLRNMGANNVSVNITEAVVDGKTMSVLKTTSTLSGVPLYQMTIVLKCGTNHIANVTITTYHTDSINDILSNLYFVE